jgi:hypothetical protein
MPAWCLFLMVVHITCDLGTHSMTFNKLYFVYFHFYMFSYLRKKTPKNLKHFLKIFQPCKFISHAHLISQNNSWPPMLNT